MNIIELFAGSCSFSRVAKARGHNTFATDVKSMDGIDYACDILDFDVNQVPFIPNVIWASPDCAVWSKAAGALHFNSRSLQPKSPKAELAFRHIDKMIEVISFFLKKNPKMLYFIENPEGRLNWVLRPNSLYSKIPGMALKRITQSSYGRIIKKKTHIFTNCATWQPRPLDKRILHNNMKNNHPGWSRKDYYARAMIPAELCSEIIEHCEEKFSQEAARLQKRT